MDRDSNAHTFGSLKVAPILVLLVGCAAFPEPVPEYAIESCLLAHGRPIFVTTYNRTEFTCEFNEELDSRYFNIPQERP